MTDPNRATIPSAPDSGTPTRRQAGAIDFNAYQETKIGIHRELLDLLDLEKIASAADERTQRQVLGVIQELVSTVKAPFDDSERERLALEILDEVFGLGPLEPLLQDPSINDILVNGAGEVYIERQGVLEETKVVFKDNAHLMRIINQIVSAVGRSVDEHFPMVDARLPDGSRVNVIIPPLSIDGPHLSIRRFGQIPIGEDISPTRP